MKKSLFVFLCAVTWSVPALNAQYLRGRVIDRTREPVPYATVYISEWQQGITANEAGIFELSAPTGDYNLIISRLGYKTTRIQWPSGPKFEGTIKTVTLEDAEYQIPPVYVTAKKEDPAYTIMRKAIGMAPYYRNIVESYRAEVYLKGSVNVTKFKGIVSMAMNREQRRAIKDLSGIQESVSEIHYTAPDKYVQTVISEKTAANVDLKKLGMGDNDIQMGLADLNIYSNRPNMPLAPHAFQNYSFTYMGDSEIDGQWVAKVRVTPRRKASDLFTGYLFIVREKWCVQALELSASQQYFKTSAQQTYRFVSDDILLPVAYTIKGEFDGFGVGGHAQFSGSIKYSDVKQNRRMAQTAPLMGSGTPRLPADAREQNTARQIQELLDKPELRSKDMRQLRNMQDRAVAIAREEERRERGEKPSLEVVSNYKMVRDSVRMQQDSVYWAAIRPAPLARREQAIIMVSDSIRAAPQTPEGKRKRGMEIAAGILGGGYTFKPDSLWRISYSGVVNAFETAYNTVDGIVYGQALRVQKETGNDGYIQLRGRASWAFSRKAFMWNILAEQRYWADRRAYWSLELSSQTRDFAGDQGVGLVNEWSTLLFRINPSRFYGSRGIDFNHRIDIANGLVWHVGAKWEERHPLANRSEYSLFYRDCRSFAPNIPQGNPYVFHNPALAGASRAAVLRLGLSYTPRHYYRMYEGRKIMLSSKYPTFSVEWIKGIPDVWNAQSDFDFFHVGMRQSYDFGYYHTLEYQGDAGKFFNTKQLYFVDFHHIYTNQGGVSLNRDFYGFQLLDTYMLSTPEWYVQAHARYVTPYLALKYLPVFRSPLVRESIQVSCLLHPVLRNYVELGYSLNNLFMILDAGVFVGFEQAEYRRWGFRLSIPLERIMNAVRL